MRAVLLTLTIWCVLCAFKMMGRRFRLSDPRKNEEWKKITCPSCIISTCIANGEYATWHLTVIAPTNSFTLIVDILTSIFLSKLTYSVICSAGA